MTLADILKPPATVAFHAQLKGAQLGGCAGLALALPALSLAPSTFNARAAPPLVAVARVAGALALAGSAAATLACAARLSRLSRAEVQQRADKLVASENHASDVRSAAAGAALGVALLAVRVRKLAAAHGTTVRAEVCSARTAWDAYCFGAMGAAAAFAAVKGAQLLACALARDGKSCHATATGEMRAVQQNVQQAVQHMSEQRADDDDDDAADERRDDADASAQ